jgi:hypothetical protein
MIRPTILAVALALVAGAAHAAPISTGALPGETLSCAVTNVGTKNAKITSIDIFNLDGTPYETQQNTCGAVLGPKATCFIVLTGETYAGHCEVEGTGKLKVSLQGFGPTGVLTGALSGSK